MTNVLFVCSRNQWRSPTAEKIFENDPELQVRSAGTSSKARRRVAEADLKWADMIVVMEDKHSQRLRAQFGQTMGYKKLYVLDIPDEYRFMDPELVDVLTEAITPLLD